MEQALFLLPTYLPHLDIFGLRLLMICMPRKSHSTSLPLQASLFLHPAELSDFLAVTGGWAEAGTSGVDLEGGSAPLLCLPKRLSVHLMTSSFALCDHGNPIHPMLSLRK